MTLITRRRGALLGLASLILAGVLGLFAVPAQAETGTPHLILTLKDGDVDIQLMPEIMAQTGDVKFGKSDAATFDLSMAGMGGSDMPDVKAEFSPTHYDRGIVGAARSNDPDTFNSQFFITFADAGFLDGQYTVFGKVVSGMEFVDAIKKGDPQSGAVPDPDKIIAAKIVYK